jgi:hypothetical protein
VQIPAADHESALARWDDEEVSLVCQVRLPDVTHSGEKGRRSAVETTPTVADQVIDQRKHSETGLIGLPSEHTVGVGTEAPYGRSRRRITSTGVGGADAGQSGVPCPSSVDPDRNRHRTRGSWALRTVAVILANPRDTGRQAWNRRATGPEGPASKPALSAKVAHPALVTEQDLRRRAGDPGCTTNHRLPSSPVC